MPTRRTGTPAATLFQIEIENLRTHVKTITGYQVEIEVETPFAAKSQVSGNQIMLGHFEVNFVPYLRESIMHYAPNGINLKHALLLGKTEVKRDMDLYSVTVYSVGANFSKELNLHSSRLTAEVELGLHALGYRYVHLKGGETFSGLELIGAYPSANFNYALGRQMGLSFTIEDASKVAVAPGKTPIIENKTEFIFGLHPKSERKFLKHFDSIWYMHKVRSNSGLTFDRERTHNVGITLGF